MIYLAKNPRTLSYSRFEHEAERLLAAGELSSYVWIVPTAAKAKELEQCLVRLQKGRAVSDLPIYTLSGLASSLLSHAKPSLRVITDAESGVFLEQAIRDLIQKSELQYFEPRDATGLSLVHSLPLPQGTFEMVLNTIRQLKSHGIYPYDLERELKISEQQQGETTEVRRARDICAIYKAYEAQLTDCFTDTYGQFMHLNARYAPGPMRPEEEALQTASTDFHKAFPDAKHIVIDGFMRIERPDLHLLLTLSSVKDVEMIIGLGACSTNPELFTSALDLLERLKMAGFEECAMPDGTRFSKDCDTLTSHLCESLFLDEPNTIDAHDRVTVFSARTKTEEVEQVARAIKLLLDTKPELKNDLSRIAISSAREYDYTELFRETFRRYNIPVNITDRYKLEGSPLMTGMLALLEVAARGLRRRDVLRALTSPYFVFMDKKGELLDPANLLRVVTEFKVSGDVDSWQRYLAQHRSEFERKRRHDDLDEMERRDVELKLSMIDKALHDIETLIGLLAPFRIALTPWMFKHHLHALFFQLRFGDRLLESSHATIGAGTLELDTRSYRAFIKLLEDLDALFSLMGIQDEELPVSFYLERLRTASLWTRFNPRFKHGYIHIASLEQITGIEFDHLFVVGMSDGVFPSAYEPQVFLMDSMQKGEVHHLSEERMLLWTAVRSAQQHLYLSYPEFTQSGAELTPSPFIADIKRCCNVTEGLSEEISSSIFCYDELFVQVGKMFKSGSSEQLAALFQKLTAANIPEVGELLNFAPQSIAAQTLRRSKKETEYRGSLDLQMLTEKEKSYLDSFVKRTWSISQLERYAACPYSFFAQSVLGLDQIADLEEGLDAMEQGNFLHSLLREFLTSRRDRGEPALQDLNEGDLEPAFTEARSLAMRRLKEMDTQHPFWQLDTERILGQKGKDGVLERFVRKEQMRGDLKTRPRYFEASFGNNTGLKSESDHLIDHPYPVEIGGIKLRGKIDRIDMGEGGFTIVDYKSGNSKKMKHIERGTSLQLPLYLRVAEDLLRTYHKDLHGVAALYHKVMDHESKRELGIAVKSYMSTHFEKMRGSGLVESEQELQDLIERTIDRAKSYVEGMTQGKFNLTDKDLIRDSCSYCGYYHACRVKEAKDYDVLLEPRLPSVA